MGPWQDRTVSTGAFRSFAAICGSTLEDGEPRRAGYVDAGRLDPKAISDLVARHRIATRAIEDLAAVLVTVDLDAAGRLAAHARTRRLLALHRAGWMATISRALAAQRVRHLGLKGPVLAMRLYGDVTARDSKDVDILVEPASLREARDVLSGMGFQDASFHEGAGDPFANKHQTFVGHGVEVELHARLLDVEALLPMSFEVLWSRHETVLLGNDAVPVLSSVDTLLYLCGHGAQHLWFRLKWLEDIARIVVLERSGHLLAMVDEALAIARGAGAEPIVASALQLVTDVFGIETPAATSTSASRRIVRLSIAALAAPAEIADAPPLSWIVRKLPVQFGMSRSWRYRRDLVRLLALAPRNFDVSDLPKGLGWLCLPLRPFMLLWDRWGSSRESHGLPSPFHMPD